MEAEIMMNTVVRTLLGQEVSPQIRKALCLLSQRETPHQELLAVCQRAENWRVTAKIITAVTNKDPWQVDKWLETLRSAFIEGDKQVLFLPVGTTFGFLAGLPLGLFESGCWVTQHCSSSLIAKFEELLPQFIAELITWNGQIPVTSTEEGLPLAEEKDYEVRLSRTVKAYFRPPTEALDPPVRTLESRRADALKIIAEVLRLWQLKKEGGSPQLPKLGEMILKQICFAIAGPMNSLALAHALHIGLQNPLVISIPSTSNR